MKLRDIAHMLHAEVEGDGGIDIRRVAKIEEAGEGDITFVANPKYARFLDLDTRFCRHCRPRDSPRRRATALCPH